MTTFFWFNPEKYGPANLFIPNLYPLSTILSKFWLYWLPSPLIIEHVRTRLGEIGNKYTSFSFFLCHFRALIFHRPPLILKTFLWERQEFSVTLKMRKLNFGKAKICHGSYSPDDQLIYLSSILWLFGGKLYMLILRNSNNSEMVNKYKKNQHREIILKFL